MPHSHRTLSHHGHAARAGLAPVASRKGGLTSILLALAGGGLLYKMLSRRSSRSRGPNSAAHQGRDVHLSSSVSIHKPALELFNFWKDFSNLPRIMTFLEKVEPREGKVSHWVARIPGGPALEWDSEVVEESPPHRLSWRSLEGSEIQTWGTVTFEPRAGGRETEVSVSLNFNPPGGPAGSAAANFLKGLESSALKKNLRSLKEHMESGEFVTGKHVDTDGKRFAERGPGA